MLSILQGKYCPKCKDTKARTEFYPRSGGKYLCTYCKACMKHDSKTQKKVDPQVSTIPTENDVICELSKLGIPALPGKAFSHQWADVAAYGCVLIEIKSSTNKDGQFEFGFSHIQRNKRLRGSLIVLVCKYDDHNTFHVFPSNYSGFYDERGKLKRSACWTPNRSSSGRPSVFTDEIMKHHLNAWHLVDTQFQRVCQRLRAGQQLDEIFSAK